MSSSNYQNDDVKIICPDDCGNAPKKNFLKELTISFARNNMEFIIDNITDDFCWNIIGHKLIQGKENFVQTVKQMQNNLVTELEISKFIAHGYDGSVNGSLLFENKKSYAFCNVYRFSSSRNNSKIKECTSYVIEVK
ncbi:hypothetical protein [Bacillus massiliigorillae]|uniref:hypothetical protein n=1 Tax=Bacillus massiliigorillae TaxID=1243664 RepID=UPI0005A84B32|nr:hypothetical protein [Bacillus massiliigorillae]